MDTLIMMVSPYLVCAGLLFFLWQARKGENRALARLVFVVLILASAAGFALLYLGPFAKSGKTFASYVTRYAVVSLSLFLFPIAGAVLMWKTRRKSA